MATFAVILACLILTLILTWKLGDFDGFKRKD